MYCRLDGRKGPTEGSIGGEGQPELGIEEGEGGVAQVNCMRSL